MGVEDALSRPMCLALSGRWKARARPPWSVFQPASLPCFKSCLLLFSLRLGVTAVNQYFENRRPLDILLTIRSLIAMKLDELRWGIVGCGDVCEVKSGPALYKTPRSKLVAVMRRDAG